MSGITLKSECWACSLSCITNSEESLSTCLYQVLFPLWEQVLADGKNVLQGQIQENAVKRLVVAGTKEGLIVFP